MYIQSVNNVTSYSLDGCEWYPAIAGGKSGGSTTVVNTLPAKTDTQLELEKEQLLTLKRQEQGFAQSAAFQDPNSALAYLNQPAAERDPASPFAGVEKFDSPTFRDQLQQSLRDVQLQRDIGTQSLQMLKRQTDINQGTFQLNSADQALLDQTYASAQSLGEQNLTRYLGEAANMRGLNISDSPIASEGAREARNLNLGLQSAKAASTIDLSQRTREFNAGLAQFGQGLQQQAFANRMALASYQQPAMAPLYQGELGQRYAQATSKTSYQIPGWQVALGFTQAGATGLGAGIAASR